MKKCARSLFGLALLTIGLQGAVTLSSNSAIVAPSAGFGSFSLSLNPATTWSATSSAAWLTVSPTGGSADAVVGYSWTANTLTVARTATITVAGASFAVLQLGSTGAYTAWNSGGYGKVTQIAEQTSSSGVFVDANDNVFFTDNPYPDSRIRRLDASTGVVTTVAGTTTSGFSGDGGLAVSAQLNSPYGIVLDVAGDIYFSDSENQRVRRIDAVTGIITTVAGNGTGGFSGDGGLAVNSELWDPEGLAMDAAGDIFIADRENSRIREIYAATGKIATVAGDGVFGFSGDGGPATSAVLSGPEGVYVDSAGNLFIADTDNNRVRRVDAVTGNISTFAGGGSSAVDGFPATQTNIYGPADITGDARGNLFIATGQDLIREVVASTGLVQTVVSNVTPSSIAVDGLGNIFFTSGGGVQFFDSVTPQITLGSTAALVSSAAGSGNLAITVSPVGALWYASGGTSWFTLTSPSGAGSGTIGYSYTANNTPQPRSAIVQLYGQTFLFTQAGFAVALAPSSVVAPASGGGGTVSLTVPAGAAWNASSSASWLGVSPASATGSATLTYTYAANAASEGRIAAISVLGQQAAVSQLGAAGVFTPWGTSAHGVITTIAGNGMTGGTGDGGAAAAATLGPEGVATDSNGNLFITDAGANFVGRIRRVDASTGLISTYAGGGTGQYSSGASATSVALPSPQAIALDSSGNVFFSNVCGVGRVDAVTRIITAVAGTGVCGYGGDGGPATSALLNNPAGIALDAAGNLYIVDHGNLRIRRLDAASGVITTIAGTGFFTTETNGVAAISSSIGSITGIAVDAIGNVYIGDTNSIRKIDVSTGLISIALSGEQALALAFDSQSNLYASDASRVWLVNPVAGTKTVVAGQLSSGYGGDGGPALLANLSNPYGVFVDPVGNLYIADTGNNRVRFVDFTSPQIALSANIAELPVTAGSGTLGITTNPTGGLWFASSNAAWLTLSASSGAGSGNLSYNYTANNSLAPRTGIITLGGQTLIVTQAGAAVALSQTFVSVGATGSSGTVGLTVTPSVAWTAQSSATWLTVSPGSGSAGTTLTYTFGTNSGADARIATITVADQTLTVLQAGAAGSWSVWATGSFYGQIRTIAGNPALTGAGGDYGPALLAGVDPLNIAIDGSGNIYFVDNNRVRRIDTTTGIITPVAGNGTSGYSGDGGSALVAGFSYSLGVALDTAGNLFIADGGNQRVRRVDAVTGIVTTVAGTGVAGIQGDDGPATSAQLNTPVAVALDNFGNLFIAEQARIRRIDAASGVITTVAGNGVYGFGGDGGPAVQAQLSGPTGLAIDAAGDIYIADRNNQRIRRVDAVTGLISTVAGDYGEGYSGDGGLATTASFYYPQGVTVDRSGNLYIADNGNQRIRRVDGVTGIISTIAGTGGYISSGDGGTAVDASFSSPYCVAMDGAGNLYICDSNLIRFIDLATPQITLAAPSASAGSSGGSSSVAITAGAGVAWSAVSDAAWLTVNSGTGTGAGTVSYTAAANNTPFSRTGVIAVLGQTFTVTQPAASVTLSALSATVGPGAGSGTFGVTTGGAVAWTAQSSATWLTITSTATSGNGTVTYTYSANTSANARTAFVIAAGRSFGIVQMGAQGNYVQWGPSYFGALRTIAGIFGSPGSSADGIAATLAQLAPTGIAADGAGNFWITDIGTNRVRRVDVVTGLISTVAGNGTVGLSGDGGAATSAELNQPNGVAVDLAGNLFIADTLNNRIRRVDAVSGTITTFAGGGSGGDGGLATAAALSSPGAVFVDAGGNVYIADKGNNRVRVVDAITGVISTVAGTGIAGQSGDGGPASLAQLQQPAAVAVDQAGNVFTTGSNSVRRVDASTGIISSISSSQYYWGFPTSLIADIKGDLFVGVPGAVYRIDATSGTVTPVASGTIESAAGLAIDAGSNLYIADRAEGLIDFVDLSSPVISLGASTANVTSDAGSGSVSITVTPSGDSWMATSTAAWLTVATPTGIGSGSIGYSFSENTSPDQRVGVISVLGQTLTVTQAGAPGTPPMITFSPGPAIVPPNAGSGTFSLTVSPATAWTATSSAAWLTVSPGGASVSATVTYSFTANTGVNGRTATITAGTAQFQVVQLGTSGAYNPWGAFGYGIIQTIAGNGNQGFSGDGGPATAAGLYLPNNSYGLRYPLTGLAIDSNGDLFFAEPTDGRIRRVDSGSGVITTVAGNGSAGYSGDFGSATSATLNGPNDVKVDSAGDLFIADTGNNVIRRVDGVSGVITTVAGTGLAGFSGDSGPATSATLNAPLNLILDAAGNIFVADANNNRIRRIDAVSGLITTLAGTGAQNFGGDGGQATAAMLARPEALATDSGGNLYVVDSLNYRVRRIDAVTGIISTVAGNGTQNTAEAGAVAATSTIGLASGLALDRTGDLYIDTYYGVLEVSASTGLLSAVAGGGSALGDGGPALKANFDDPGGVALDAAGDLYIVDTDDERIRMVDFSSPQTTLSASAATVGQYAGAGSLGITVSPAGALWSVSSSASWLTLTTSGAGSGTIAYSYAANTSPTLRIATISAYGQVFTLTQQGVASYPLNATVTPASAAVSPASGTGTFSVNVAAGVAWTATSSAPWLSISPGSGSGAGTLTYTFTANAANSARMAAIVVAGATFSLNQAGVSGNWTQWGSSGYGIIRTIAGRGTMGPPPLTGMAPLSLQFGPFEPSGVQPDLNGNVLIAAGPVMRIDAATGLLFPVTNPSCCFSGTGEQASTGGDGGPASLAFTNSTAITADATGNLFISDANSGRIRRVDAQTQIITTVAGNGSTTESGDGGPATAAGLSIGSVAVDSLGNLYIADSNNNRVRVVNGATGVITTFAGNGTAGFAGDGGAASGAELSSPDGVATYAGYLYIADAANNRIRRVDSTGKILTVAGTGTSGFAGDGGAAASAELASPVGVALDAAGNLFIADSGGKIVRRVDAVSGIIMTVAGGGTGGDGGPATSAALDPISSISVDAQGNLYIAGNDVYNGRLRFVDFSSPCVSFAGTTVAVGNSAGTGGIGLNVSPAGAFWVATSDASWLTLTTPTGSGSGNIQYSFTANSTAYARTAIISVYGQNVIVTQAGASVSLTPASAIGAAAAGSGTFALTVQPSISWTAISDASWLTVSPASGTGSTTLTYTFTANTAMVSRAATISLLGEVFEFVQPGSLGTYTPQYTPWGTTFAGQIITIAGNGTSGYSGDGGPAIAASLNQSAGMALDGSGNLFVADTGNNVIRRVDALARTISTVAGNGIGGFSSDGGPAVNSRLGAPGDVAVDSAGNVYIADTGNGRIRRVDAVSGVISTIAGTGVAGTSGDGGPAAAATLTSPNSLALDNAGNIYFSDTGRIRRIAATTGVISTVAGGGSSVADGVPATSASFASITAFCMDGQANLFILDRSAARVRRVDSGSGVIVTIAGQASGGSSTGNGGLAALASFASPAGIACDSAGNVYVTDGSIRRIDAASGIIAAFPSSNAAAGISGSGPLATDANGNLYISGSGGLTILFVDGSTPAVTLTSPTTSVTWTAGAGTAGITVATAGAPWYASSNSQWLTVTTPDGTGSGSVGFSVTANNSVVSRTGAITISGQTLLVTQTGIPVSFSAQSATVGAAASSSTVNLTIPSSVLWNATSTASWLTVGPQSGTGNATLTYTWTANPSSTARMGSIIVMGTRFGVVQAGNTGNVTPWGSSVRGQIITVAGGGSNPISPGTGRFGGISFAQNTATDANGNFYVTTGDFIYQIQAGTGAVSVFSGSGSSSSYSGDGGPATQATISVNRLTADVTGNIYFSDQSGRVLRVDAVTDIITTVAGNGTAVYAGDDVPATATGFAFLSAVAVDPAGNVYMADGGGIHRVDQATGLVSTVSGISPYALASDATGNIYAINGNVVRLDFSTGTTPVVAGVLTSVVQPGIGDGGPATAATLNYPRGIAFDGNGNLFISDAGFNTVRRVDATTGLISTVAGQANYTGSFSGDGGQAVSAGLNYPAGISADPAGNIYFADANNGRIRFVDLSSPGNAAQSQTITFPSLSNAILGSTPSIPSGATSSSGLPVVLTTNTPAVCIVASLQIVPVSPGFCSVTASQPGNATYGVAAPVTQYLTVLATQSITFGAIANVAVGAAPFTLNATASSGLAVTFTSNTPTVCTVSVNTVTILSSGGCSISATLAGSSYLAPAAPVTQRFTVLFSDVSSTDTLSGEVNAFAQYGITSGCALNQFCPTESVTRDEMAVFIVRAIYGSDNFTYTPTPYFTDVTPSTFGFKWIQKLKDLGITSGCTATTYCPGEVVTRDQMAIFIIRARLGVSIAGPTPTFTYPSTPYFTDATAANEFAYAWIQRMRLENITSGCTATTYCPLSPVTREEMATFIMRGAFNQFLPAGTPLLTQISPATLPVGTSGTYTITGTNTNFVQGTTQLSPIPGVTIGTITVTSATTMTVELSVTSNVVAQPYSILAITGNEQEVLPNGLVLQ